jgi:hypothetical protein
MVAIKNESEHNVPLLGPDGRVHHTLPGDVFPEWASDKVTNPDVIGDQFLDPESRKSRFDEELAELRHRHGIDEDGKPAVHAGHDEDEPSAHRAEGGPPPKTGRGSSIDAWRDYALDQEIDVQEDWTREQIIAELEAAGKPV